MMVGEDQHHYHSNVKLLYRQHYYDTYVYVISCIKERFDIDQLDFELYPQMQSLLSKAENGI